MRKIWLTLFILCAAGLSYAQSWQTSGSNLYFNTGSVAIGTATPASLSALDVNGKINIGGTGSTDAMIHVKDASSWDRLTQMTPAPIGYNRPALNLIASVTSANQFQWWAWGVLPTGQWALQPAIAFSGATGLFIDRNGSVGIGVTDPDAKLAVSGQIHATEIRISANVPGPDYVFARDYNLPTLEAIESYINQHKHLPEVPSATEMEADGIKVGEMNMLLLKKIEELTLYVIELKKENALIRKDMETLKSRN